MKKKNIFETLEEKKILYAVGRSRIGFKLKTLEESEVEYYVIIQRKDKDSLKCFRSDHDNKFIGLRTLNRTEVLLFKSNLSKYDVLIDNEDGKIFELKGVNFNQKYSKYAKEQAIKDSKIAAKKAKKKKQMNTK